MADDAKKAPRAVFVTTDGEFSRNPGDDVTEVRCVFNSYEPIVARPDHFPENIRGYLAWHGLKQLLGDTRAGEAKEGEDATYDKLSSLVERLQSGDWVKEREAVGPSTTLVYEAMIAAMTKAGKAPDETGAAELREVLKDKDERKAAMEDPRVKLEYERLQLARKQARLAKLEEEAAKGEGKLAF